MSFPAPIGPEKFQIGGSSPSGLGRVHTPEGQRPGSTPGSYEIPGLGVQSTGGFYTESFKDFKANQTINPSITGPRQSGWDRGWVGVEFGEVFSRV